MQSERWANLSFISTANTSSRPRALMVRPSVPPCPLCHALSCLLIHIICSSVPQPEPDHELVRVQSVGHFHLLTMRTASKTTATTSSALRLRVTITPRASSSSAPIAHSAPVRDHPLIRVRLLNSRFSSDEWVSPAYHCLPYHLFTICSRSRSGTSSGKPVLSRATLSPKWSIVGRTSGVRNNTTFFASSIASA